MNTAKADDFNQETLIERVRELEAEVARREYQDMLKNNAFSRVQESYCEQRALLRYMPDTIIELEEYGTIFYVNHDLQNVSASALRGCSVYEYMSAKEGRLISKALELIADTRFPESFEIESADDAQYCALEYKLSPLEYSVPQRVMLIIRDVTEQKKAAKAMYESATKLSNHRSCTPLGVVYWDLDFNVIEWNPAAEKIFGYSKQDALGKNGIELVVLDSNKTIAQDHFDNLLFHCSDENIIAGQSITKDGREITCTWHNTRLTNEDGTVIAMASLIQDVTEQISTRKELKAAKQLAEQSAKTKSEFLANMSHEIRTPMNGILGSASLLLDQDLSTQAKQFVNIIHYSAESLLAVINDILDFSKIDAGEMKTESIPMNIYEVINGACDLLRHSAEQKSLRLHVDISKTLEQYYYGDPSRLRQIILNLVGNAIKFTEHGQVRIGASAGGKDRGDISIVVVDTGVGIPNNKLDQIFQEFSQADNSVTRRFGGTGLGLAISKKLATLMGGDITVESQVGVGSQFAFSVPLSTCKADSGITSESTLKSLTRDYDKHVLLVEDNQTNLIVGKKILERLGIRVDVAVNGVQAIERVLNFDYDLVLMDVQMPTMDGLEATRCIRNDKTLKQPYIIALTANALEEDRRCCMDSGMNGFVSKPMRLNNLIKELDLVFAE